MADCNETIRQLYAYLDEMLDEVLKNDIALHLGDCPDCQGRVEFVIVSAALVFDRTRT